MTNVSPIAPQHRALEAPEPLRRLPGWLIWRYEDHGEAKPRKVPYYVDGGRRSGVNGSPSDRNKLTTFADARDAAARRGFDGVGLAMLPDWGVTALDFDRCVDADGKLPKEIEAIVADTYAEYSPSGVGIRAFVQGDLGNAKTDSRADKLAGRYGVETFSSTGFVTFTGRPLAITELLGNENVVAPATEAVRKLIRSRLGESRKDRPDSDDPFFGFEPRLELTVSQMETLLKGLDPSMGREEWIKVGMALHHETSGDDTGLALWDEWSSGGQQYPGSEAIEAQWASFDRREGSVGRPVTMASVIKMHQEAQEKARSGVGPDELFSTIAEQVKSAMPEGVERQGVKTPSDYGGRYKIESAASYTQRPPTPWLIKDVLPQADLAVLFGASGSGKTFVALDMAAAVARGVPWRDKRVKKGRVVIIAAEGGGGVGKRIDAYCKRHGIDPSELDIGIINAAPSLMDRDDMSEVVAAIVAAGGADLCIMDTFAQMTAGADENSAGEMGRALSHAKALRVATGATVMIVHHTGKDSTKGARGSTAIRGAADAEIEVVRFQGNERLIRTTKQKDSDDGAEWGFKLEVVEVGADEDGDPITSCVAVEAEAPKPPVREPGGKSMQDRALGRYEAHIVECMELVDKDKLSMHRAEFAAFVAEQMVADPDARDVRKQNINRAVATLARKKDAPIMLVGDTVVFME
ncbi:replicative DNA helicase/ DNA primase [Caulobacter phage KcrB]|nr:replicative DNA helicase [Caulobacter phage RW]WCA46355.1 replicative DNA helicase/ DNA primase [Caulobacter phage KcrB]WCD56290.1 replicative DNA helicase/ DNA primase [Caulobacter phage RLK]WNV48082.1 replicative DNA helicase / DNA primase [Caulobacter phage GB2A]